MDASNFRLLPEQWARLRTLLGEALDLPPAAREPWLDALGADDAPLTARLRALLAHADARTAPARPFALLPKVETADFAPHPPETEAGELVGPYRLLDQIGEGGMATVWLAERTDWPGERRVALKLPHGAWRRAGLVERFARERAILAGLEHPHIARLYDAGVTATGQPFLALEYVEGERIDRWCDTHGCGLAQRIALFLQICEAVAHAHARLIVHRDIKPTNVLVDARGQVRLLDFGIAKLLQDDAAAQETALTREAGRALTPEYAAPEQLLGEAISTATDTYAMGVLLYELLAGSHPYAAPGGPLAARTQAALNADPVPPSKAAADAARARALRGDLDTIVLKAMKRTPAERYPSAEAMAADLRRHLAHEPVLARPDGAAYRLRKLLRRHRVAVLAGASVALALVAGAAVALWQAHDARVQRDAALRAQKVASAQTQLAGLLLMEMEAQGETLAAQLQRARRMFDAQYRDDPGLRGQLLKRMGDLFSGRGEERRAIALWAEAEPLLRDHGEWEALADLQCARATRLVREGKIDDARASIAGARQQLARAGVPATSVAYRHCLTSEGVLERTAGNTGRAVVLLEQAVDLHRSSEEDAAEFVELLNTLARTYRDDARYGDAVRTARRAADAVAQFGFENTGQDTVARVLQALALRDGGRPLDALALQPPPQATGAFRLSERVQRAITLVQLGRWDGLLADLDDMLAAGRSSNAGEARTVRLLQAETLTHLGRHEEAGAALDDADALFAALRRDKAYPAHRPLLTRAAWALATARPAQAQAALDEALPLVTATGQPNDFARHAIYQLQARVFLATGRAADALKQADAALAWSERLAIDPSGSLHIAEDRLLRARAQRMLGNLEQARADAALAERHARAAGGDAHPTVRLAHEESLRAR